MKFFLLGAVAAFDDAMINMMRSMSQEHRPTFVEIEVQMDKEEYHPRVEQMKEVLMKHQIDTFPKADDQCKTCIEKVVKCWYTIAFKKMEDWCKKDSKCPQKDKICDMFHKEPEVFSGMMWVWGHPLDDGYFYCMGKKDCKEPSMDLKPKSFGEDNLMQSVENLNLSIAFGEKEDTTAMELYQTQEEIEEILMQGDLKMFGGAELTGDDDFKKCVRKSSCWVMKHVIKQICEWCKKATKPEDKEKCDWMKAHKKFTFGVLLAVVQPWKYAEGYCYKKKPTQQRLAKIKYENFMHRLNAVTDEIQENQEFHS